MEQKWRKRVIRSNKKVKRGRRKIVKVLILIITQDMIIITACSNEEDAAYMNAREDW